MKRGGRWDRKPHVEVVPRQFNHSEAFDLLPIQVIHYGSHYLEPGTFSEQSSVAKMIIDFRPFHSPFGNSVELGVLLAVACGQVNYFL